MAISFNKITKQKMMLQLTIKQQTLEKTNAKSTPLLQADKQLRKETTLLARNNRKPLSFRFFSSTATSSASFLQQNLIS